MARKYGKHVKNRHKMALNRLALILSDNSNFSDPKKYHRVGDFEKHKRITNPRFVISRVHRVPSPSN